MTIDELYAQVSRTLDLQAKEIKQLTQRVATLENNARDLDKVVIRNSRERVS